MNTTRIENYPVSTAEPMEIDFPKDWHFLPPTNYYKIFRDSTLSARDLLNASCVCRQWHFYIHLPCVASELLNRLPIIPRPPKEEPLLKTYGYWSRFPAGENNRTYNYKIGKERMMLAHQKRVIFEAVIQSGVLNVFVREHQRVSGNIYLALRVTLISHEKTLNLAKKSIERWGKNGAEIVLSATKTGSVFWNILYNFGSMELVNLLLESGHILRV